MKRDETPGKTSADQQHDRPRLGPEDYEWQHPPDWPGDYWPSRQERSAQDLVDFMTGNVDPRSLSARRMRGEEVWDLSVQPWRASLSKRSKELFFVLVEYARTHGFPEDGAPMLVPRDYVVGSFRPQWQPDEEYQALAGVTVDECRAQFARSESLARAAAELSQKRVPYRLWTLPMQRPDRQLDGTAVLGDTDPVGQSFGLLTMHAVRENEAANGEAIEGERDRDRDLDMGCSPRVYRPMPEAYAVYWDAETKRALESGVFGLVRAEPYLSLLTGWEQALYRFLANQLQGEAEADLDVIEKGVPGRAARGGTTIYVGADDLVSFSEAYGGGAGLPVVLEDRLDVLQREGSLPWLAPVLDSVSATGLFTWEEDAPLGQDGRENIVAGSTSAEREIAPDASGEAVVAFTLELPASGRGDGGRGATIPTREGLAGERSEDVRKSLLRLFEQPGEDEAVSYLKWVW